MPPQKRNNTPPVSSADRIGALPDSILHQLLSFLPAQEAVRTCVLARRWRHLWRSSTGLRIDGHEYSDFRSLQKFVDHLVFLRERTDLDSVEIKLAAYVHHEDHPYVNLWIRFAVKCKVRVLSLDNFDSDLYIDDLPLVSRRLRTLHLDSVTLQETFLDFASCPALEDLKMDNCSIRARKVSSRSLKHLSITNCWSDLYYCRLHVCTPGLISLNLVLYWGRTPFLENMVLLETAYVDIGEYCKDACLNYDSGVFCGDNNNACENCVPIQDDRNRDCVLLGGISSAKHLKLLSESTNFIFARDLKHCPTFSKLKTLLLNEYWCDAPDLDPLVCIVKNSPVLKKLTLQLFSKGPNHKVEMKGRCISMEQPSAIFAHLSIIEVKCNVVDERILKVLKFLSACNICFSFE